jgi:hypothetical protein
MLVARALGTYAHSRFIAANQRCASLLYSAIARAHHECSVRDRHKRIVGIEENAMPAESIRAAHSVLTEISAHPVSKSSLTETLHHPTPTQKSPVRAGRGIFSRLVAAMFVNGSRVGYIAERIGSLTERFTFNRRWDG